MENDKKRLFIAIDLPENVKNCLYKAVIKLNEKDKEIKSVPVSNIHLTLKFLGDVLIERIGKVSSAVENTAKSIKASSFSIGDMFEAFPDSESARIIYAPVVEGADLIESFYRSLEDNLSKIKIRKESRKFIPHITVARIKGRKNITHFLKEPVQDCFINKKCSFSKVTLFESILKPSGAKYTILKEYELK